MPPRRAPRTPPRRDGRRSPKGPAFEPSRGRRALAASGLVAVAALALAGWIAWDRDRPRRLLDRAEAADRAGDWTTARAAWEDFHRTGVATARTLLAEARADLALDRSSDAGRALERATAVDPTLLDAWRIRLDRLRVLDRPLEALRLGRAAGSAVGPGSTRAILVPTTLAALAELPDDEARDRLDRWIAADPADLDARVARLARVAANYHDGDPDRATRIVQLAEILDRDPGHVPAREALVVALADAGEPDRGRLVLEGWPGADRDARFDRLRGRWDLDYDRDPAGAARSFERALVDLPHDWKSHYGLARAYRALGRDRDARSEAEAVARLRERLEPAALGPRLAADLARPDDPNALLDLAALCEGVGLAQLAGSWRREALAPSPAPGPFPIDH